MTILADLPKLGLVYQHTSAATTKKYIREHPDMVRRYVKSQVEAVNRIYTDKEASIESAGEVYWPQRGPRRSGKDLGESAE